MAYADAIRTVTPTMENVATLLEGLRCTYTYTVYSTLQSTVSTSAAEMTGSETTITTTAGQVVFIFANLSISGAAAGTVTTVTLYVDEEAVGNQPLRQFFEPRGNASGKSINVGFAVAHEPGAGAHTYSIYWSTGSSETSYCRSLEILAVALETSS